MSLIEVVAGIALLGGLLVMVLMANSRITKQARLTQKKLQAIRALDSMLASLETRNMLLNGSTSQEISGFKDLVWRAIPVEDSANATFGTRQIRLAVFDARDGAKDSHRTEEGLRNAISPPMLASVELVVPDESIWRAQDANPPNR